MRNNDTTAGWKLVPVEPTPEMVHALADNVDLIDYEGGSRAGYAAMLAAAPQPPAAQQGEHLLQDQDRGLSQWLASQPDARLHAREAAAAIVAQHGEAVAPSDLRERIEAAYEAAEDGDNGACMAILRETLRVLAAQPAAAPQPEPVYGDVLPPLGSRVWIRHGRDDEAHACTVVGYYAWPDLGGNKHLHRVFVHLVYEGTTRPQARMLCDVWPTEAEALAGAAPQPVAQGGDITPERAEFVAAWNGLPDKLRSHPGLKRLHRAGLALAAAPAVVAGEPVASIYITPNGEREMDDWRHDLPVGRNILYTTKPAAAPQPAIADHTCASTDLVDHESSKLSDKPTGGSPDHLLQDQSRGLSQWLASQPDARLHAREAAAEIAATQQVAQGGELPEVALTPPQDDIALQRFIHEFIHGNEPADADGARSSRGGLAEVIKEAAAPAGVAGEPVAYRYPYRFRDIGETGAYEIVAHDVAVVMRLPRGEPLYTAPPARQALTDEQIGVLQQKPECWAHGGLGATFKRTEYARAVMRACAEAWGVTLVGIGGKGGA